MLIKIINVSLILIFLSPVAALAHGDKKEAVKVTATTTMSPKEGNNYIIDSLERAEKQKGFAEISEDVKESTVPTVIKALSLAAIIAGLAFLYMPKKKKS